MLKILMNFRTIINELQEIRSILESIRLKLEKSDNSDMSDDFFSQLTMILDSQLASSHIPE